MNDSALWPMPTLGMGCDLHLATRAHGRFVREACDVMVEAPDELAAEALSQTPTGESSWSPRSPNDSGGERRAAGPDRELGLSGDDVERRVEDHLGRSKLANQ